MDGDGGGEGASDGEREDGEDGLHCELSKECGERVLRVFRCLATVGRDEKVGF